MAIDPTELAEQQEQQQRITAAGAPKEFAKGPEREGEFDVAKLGPLFDLLQKVPGPVTPKKTPSVSEDAATPPIEQITPQRVPTKPEERIVEDSPLYSYKDVQRRVAPQVLEPPALEEFQRRGFQAFPSPEETLIDEAQRVAAEDAAKAKRSVEQVKKKAQLTVSAEEKNIGVRSSDLLSGDRTKSVLERMQTMEKELKSIKDGGDFNFKNLLNGEDVNFAIQTLSEDFADEVNAVKRGVITQKETIQEAAEIIAVDELGFTKQLLKRKIGDGSFNAAQTVAGRMLLVKNMEKLLDTYAKIKEDMVTNTVSDADLLAFRRQLTLQAGIQLQVKGNQTEAARALNSYNIPVTGEEQALQAGTNATRLLNESGGRENTLEMVERFGQLAEADEPIKGINIFALKAYAAKTKEIIHQAYMAGLLSNPATQIKNILGTGSYMLYQIPSEILAGAYGEIYRTAQIARGKDVDPDQVYLRDALLRMKGWADSLQDAYSAAAVAFKTELPSGGKNRYDLEIYNPVGDVEETPLAKALSTIGKTMRLPFRFLLGADEFFKVMSARGELYTAVSRRYGDLILQGKSDEEAIAEAGMLLLDPKAVDEQLELKAKYDTMQSDLGAFGKSIGRIQENFFGRFILPFVTAPTNSMLRVVENTPLGSGYKALAPKFMGGAKTPRERQMAFGRATQAAGAIALFVGFASEGRITGSRPRDKAAREALPPGWQPYSFVVRDDDFPRDANGDMLPPFNEFGVPNGKLKYISYAGFEPVGALIGISADYTQRMSELPPSESTMQWANQYAGLAVASISEYMSELPMLQGISDIADTLKGEGLENLVKSYPQSAAVGGIVPNPLSALQRGLFDLGLGGGDPSLVKPRKELDYYTLEELEAKDEFGEYVYGTTPEGEPAGPGKYLGKVKGNTLDKLTQAIAGYVSTDSFFIDQYDKNAPQFDTFGNKLTSTDLSLANNPIAAIRNRILGFKIVPSQELSKGEEAVIRVYAETGKWPLTNKQTLEGIPLNFGAISDWTKLAKGTYLDEQGEEVRTEVVVPELGYLSLSFVDALELMTQGVLDTEAGQFVDAVSGYKTMTPKEKYQEIVKLNNLYYSATIDKLFQETDSEGNLRYESLAQAYSDVLLQKDLDR